MYHHIHLKVPRTVPHTATASPYDWGVITYLLLRTNKTNLHMRKEPISMTDYSVCDETIWQAMTPIVSAIEVWKSLPYLAVRNKKTSVINKNKAYGFNHFWEKGIRGICHEDWAVHSASIKLTRCKEREEKDKQLARPSGCLSERLKISKRTLQTLRDNGTLAYTKIGNRTYYLPEDVESIVTKVEDRRKEAKWRGREI